MDSQVFDRHLTIRVPAKAHDHRVSVKMYYPTLLTITFSVCQIAFIDAIPFPYLASSDSGSDITTEADRHRPKQPRSEDAERTSPWPTSKGPLLRLPDDVAGHHKGDIKIEVPQDVGTALNKFFEDEKCTPPRDEEGSLEHGPLRKRIDREIECLVNNLENVVDAMGQGGPLNGLAPQAMEVARRIPRPRFVNRQHNMGFGQAVMAAEPRLRNALPNLPQQQIGPALVMTFFLAFGFFINIAINVGSMFLEATLFEQQPFKEPENPWKCWFGEGGQKLDCKSGLCLGQDGKCTADLTSSCACEEEEDDKCHREPKDWLSFPPV